MQSDNPSPKLSAVKAVKTATEEVAIVKWAEVAVNVIFAENADLRLPFPSAEKTAPPLPQPSEQDHPLGTPSPTFYQCAWAQPLRDQNVPGKNRQGKSVYYRSIRKAQVQV